MKNTGKCETACSTIGKLCWTRGQRGCWREVEKECKKIKCDMYKYHFCTMMVVIINCKCMLIKLKFKERLLNSLNKDSLIGQ